VLLTLIGCSAKQTLPEGQVVEVVGSDYAFQVPEKITAGPTVFHFVNKGKVRHELNLFMLTRGTTIQQYLDRRKQQKPALDLIDGPIGVLFAGPGSRSDAGLSAELVPGRDYVAICIFKDRPNGPAHYEMGMYALIKAHGPPAVEAVASRTDSIVGVDYAFRYPGTLRPGHHSLVFENRGKVRHEMVLMRLKKGVTTDSVLKVARTNGNTDALIDDASGLLTATPGRTSLGRLEVDLLAGREYTLACFFADSANAPPHVALGMYGRILVTGPPGN
jgi:hypothetical protein